MTQSDEPGEFRVLVDDEPGPWGIITEAIGTRDILLGRYERENGMYLYTKNEGNWGIDEKRKHMNVLKRQNGPFVIENILEADKEKVCEQSLQKDWIKIRSCKLAELRALTEEEKARLLKLKGENLAFHSDHQNFHSLPTKLV